VTSPSTVGPSITDEIVENYKARVGNFEPIRRQWHSEASRDNIRHWAEAVGDDNPLWYDEEYAAATKHGVILAPPSFVLSCNMGPAHRPVGEVKRDGRSGGGLPGNVRQVWVGDEWIWERAIRLGDQVRGTTGISDVSVKDDPDRGRSMTYVTEEQFFNQHDELISRHLTTSTAMERRERKEQPGEKKEDKPKRPELTKYKYTPEELEHIEAEIDKEFRRGGDTLFWDDVEVGQEIPHVVKGPLTLTEIICFLQGWGGPFIMASEIMHKYFRRHPKANVPDFETGAPDTATRVHWDEKLAQASGFPTGYDIGGMRMSWMIHGLTNWSGDEGLVRRIKVRFTNLNLIGDTTYCRGTVSGKRQQDGRGLVDLELSTVNQRDAQTTEGQATVELPLRR
jgi:acyl dehydratase